MMKRLLILLQLLVSLFATAQQEVLILSKDSIKNGYFLDEYWKFRPGDNQAFAVPGYDDVAWSMIGASKLNLAAEKNKQFSNFNGVGWFRLHLQIDSTLLGQPMAIRMRQLGASEIYLDGQKIDSFGKIGNAKTTRAYNPINIPFTFSFNRAGHHVLAVRYANYNAQRYLKIHGQDNAGFRMCLGFANPIIEEHHWELKSFAQVLLLLAGIFGALSLQHLFLYLFYRAERSHVYFSLFTFCLSLAFLIPYVRVTTTEPQVQLAWEYLTIFVIVGTCVSLSGFINELFSGANGLGRWRKVGFYVISTLGLAIIALRFYEEPLSLVAGFFLIGITALEAVIQVVFGLTKKVRGAKILGTGILTFAFFILFVFIVGLSGHGLTVSTGSVWGMIGAGLIFCAILSIPVSMSIFLAWNFSAVNKDLGNRLREVEMLSQRTLEHEQEKKRLLETRKEELEKEVAERTAELERQHEELKNAKKQSDDLLRNILPEEVADELKQRGSTEARYFDHVTVLFTDFVNFTQAGESMTPKELVDELHTCFKSFDEIISRYGIEKIKTIGDAYLAVSGLPVSDPAHATKMVAAALEIRDYMEERKAMLGERSFHIRIGVHSGPVVAGIVGVKKFAYDIWGDTVNTAARMEQSGEAGRINISGATYDLIRHQFDCTFRGEIEAKNKGKLKMYFVETIREGVYPEAERQEAGARETV